MPDPATYPALEVEGYTPEWDERPAPSGTTHYEHARFALDNGYAVSVARVKTDSDKPDTLGVDEGRWEAALMKPQDNELMQMLTGYEFQPATELDELTTDEIDGFRVVGYLDNAGVKALLDDVAGREGPTPTTDEDIDKFFGMIFGAPVEVEEDAQ